MNLDQLIFSWKGQHLVPALFILVINVILDDRVQTYFLFSFSSDINLCGKIRIRKSGNYGG